MCPMPPVSVVAHYKTTTSTFGGTTDASGAASIPFDIGGATVANPVAVDVSVGSAACSSSFTPVV